MLNWILSPFFNEKYFFATNHTSPQWWFFFKIYFNFGNWFSSFNFWQHSKNDNPISLRSSNVVTFCATILILVDLQHAQPLCEFLSTSLLNFQLSVSAVSILAKNEFLLISLHLFTVSLQCAPFPLCLFQSSFRHSFIQSFSILHSTILLAISIHSSFSSSFFCRIQWSSLIR